MLDGLRRQTPREEGARRRLNGGREENGDPTATLRTNKPGTSNTSITDLAWSAIVAGHSSRSTLAQSGRKGKFEADWNETVLSGLQQDPLTADAWVGMYGRDDAIEEDILGAGTPFVCLYLFGWAFGKHVTGWIIGMATVVLCWASLVYISMTKDYNSAELWLEDFAVLIFSIAFFYSRVHERTPPDFEYSDGIWVALLLEAGLANTLSCMAHGVELIMDDPQGLPAPRIILRLFKFGSPVAGWAFLRNVAKDRQAQALREKNLGKGGRPTAPGAPRSYIVQNYLMKIMDRSRDLRVTGLNEGELENLARLLRDKGYDEVAKYIAFFTRKGKVVDKFDLLFAFHRGYMSWMTAGEGQLSKWVKEHRSSSFESVDSILGVINDTRGLPHGLESEVERMESGWSSFDREQQRWWLCGAMASFLDHRGDMMKTSDSLAWYALTAAVLCENRNAMAVIAARNSRSMDFGDADAMSAKVVKGCRQVLDKVTGDETISSDRSLVVTTMTPEEDPVVTYTAAEVWKAEQGREPFMLDRDTFDKLRVAQPFVECEHPSFLSDDAKRNILEKSVALASRVHVRVTFVPVLAHQLIQTRALDDVRASAWRGWLMHVVWVICAIVIHLMFPEHLLYLSTFAFFATSVDRTDLVIHVVFVGFHLWRESPFGKIALAPPFAGMDDSDINFMASWAYWTAVTVVNWLGGYMGTLPRLWCRVCFFVIIIGSTIPGLVYILFEGGNNGAEGSIEYVGRSKGHGYEHRDPRLETPNLHRPVGKDVVVRVGNTFKIASSFLQGQDQGAQTATT